MARIIQKAYRIRFLTRSEIMYIIARFPRLLLGVIKKDFGKKK